MIKNPLKTAQNGQKRPKNHLIVPEKGLKLIKMTKIPLKSPGNDQKHLKTGENAQKLPKYNLKVPDKSLKFAKNDRNSPEITRQ